MATPEAFDFNVVLRPFKSHTWKAPSRRHKPAKAILADEQRRLQAITAHHIQRQEQAREQLEALELKENPDEETVKEIEKDKKIISEPTPSFSSYLSVEAPPSVRPRKWWCDVTGLEGKYKSPRHGLRYHNPEVFAIVQSMAPGVDQQYLELRNANVVLR